MRDLLLTLGHNASAVLVEDGHVLNAYEAERITGVKSDSKFPVEAIGAIVERTSWSGRDHPFDRVYVCHWDPGNELRHMKSKYWDPSVFRKEMPIIAQEHLGLTHHDAHAYAALAFAGPAFPRHDTGILVVDGFGNFGEHLSYYRLNEGGEPMLIKRVFGYATSLGLMYQYATAFLGMKMHEDEYKLLGYGARVRDVDVDFKTLTNVAMNYAGSIRQRMRSLPDPRIGLDLGSLPKVQERWTSVFEKMLDDCGMKGVDRTSHEARCVLGYVVQKVLETTMLNVMGQDIGWPSNLICTGGVFYNVALSRQILKAVRGQLCIMPLAGDQGNALGLWAFHNRRQTLEFGDLCWGKRSFGEHQHGDLPEGMRMFLSDGPDVLELMREQLQTNGFFNLVRGDMEFGPRALCNTSTIAVADKMSVVDEINRINGRNTVMPFAPVVGEQYLARIFPEAERLHKSERFMICACDYSGELGVDFEGASLATATGVRTGRPQSYAPKYEGDSVAALLEEHGLLINTSFNVHGVPIVCDMPQIVHCHQFQRERNPNVVTIVIKEKT